MYKRLLVPLDGSALAELAFSDAAELAVGLDLECIILLHIYAEDQAEFGATHKAYLDRAVETLRARWDEARQAMGDIAAESAPEIRSELAAGKPAEDILRYAESNGVDLIMMVTHGRSGIKRWAMGSVADKVLRASQVPVWLLRATTGEKPAPDTERGKTIVVPLDGSPLAESVLPHVETLARQRSHQPTEIVLLSICEPVVPPAVYPTVAPVDMEADLSRARDADMGYLAGVEKGLVHKGLSARSVVVIGKPADEIVDYARNNPCDLIVMATHGRSGISRWVYGSVAEKLISGAPSPVLLVRPADSG